MSQNVETARSAGKAGLFLAAAERWLREEGARIAAMHIQRLSLEHAVSPGDLCNETYVSLLVTVERHGAPLDHSDEDAVAAYVYKTLEHRALDQARALWRRGREQPWPDDDVAAADVEEDGGVVGVLLGRLLFECVRRVLQTKTPLRDSLILPVALAVVTYLQVGAPPDAPRPQTKGNSWTRAGWAALHAVDPEHFFPHEGAVLPNTATQRRRAALAKARTLIQAAAVECGVQA